MASFNSISAEIQEDDIKYNDKYQKIPLITDLKKQSLVCHVFEDRTIWHAFLPNHTADKILLIARSNIAIGITCFMCVLYMFGLYTFDTGLLEENNFSTIYSIFVLLISLPIKCRMIKINCQ